MTQTTVRSRDVAHPAPAPEPDNALLRVWDRNWLGAAVAIGTGAAFGLVAGILTPRGPITTGEALLAMVVAVAVGVAAGLAMGSRWAMLVAPAAFMIVFELTRIGIDGPTVDSITFGSFYGIVAFVLGRLFHGLLVVVPMMLGAVYGIALASQVGNESAPTPGKVGWTLTGLGTVALVALAVFIARPASTAPILGADGEASPGSIAELATVPIGGHDQVMMIRGRDVDNPVLLYLNGGPGGTDLGAVRRDVALEQDFVVVTWDQRGSGKSYSQLDPTDTFTLDQMVADTIEVTNYLRERFGEEKVYLVGQSWGSTLGGLAAQQQPELYHAFVGVGQMVSQRETDVMFWEDTLTWAKANGNDALAATLLANGPPPYEDLNQYDPVISHEHEWNAYPELDFDNEMPAILFVQEYTFMDRINAFRGFLDTNGTLYPQLQELDFRIGVPRLDVPVYMVLGSHEARGRAVLADEWFNQLEAPSKDRVVFEGAGHRAHFDQPQAFADLMSRVAAETVAGSSGGGV